MSAERTLDYRARLDPRNRAFRVTAADPTLLQRPRYWTPGVVLDQGQEGSCVGHGVVGEYLASPVRGNPLTQAHLPITVAERSTPIRYFTWDRPTAGHQLAVQVYQHAKEIDEWEGVDYDGTSVRAGMLVARERGWCDGFRWAFGMLELRAALEEGPVVIGVEWRDGMYDAPDGVLSLSGPVVGGHCILVTGYTPTARGDIAHDPAYRLRNSWGSDWGHNGSAYISAHDLDRILFQSGGEAAVPSGRHL